MLSCPLVCSWWGFLYTLHVIPVYADVLLAYVFAPQSAARRRRWSRQLLGWLVLPFCLMLSNLLLLGLQSVTVVIIHHADRAVVCRCAAFLFRRLPPVTVLPRPGWATLMLNCRS